jgi:hypothetical protein
MLDSFVNHTLWWHCSHKNLGTANSNRVVCVQTWCTMLLCATSSRVRGMRLVTAPAQHVPPSFLHSAHECAHTHTHTHAHAHAHTHTHTLTDGGFRPPFLDALVQVEIRKAYKQKALKLHPDKNPDKPDAATIFHRLVKAYDLLSDEKAKEA